MSYYTVYFSGGTTNITPSKSIGGSISFKPIYIGTNNLFPNISIKEARLGKKDYRCVYIKNKSTYEISDTQIFVDSEVDGGSNVRLGIDFKNDIQIVIIKGNITSGSMVLSYVLNSVSYNFTVNYNSTLSTWASNFQNALNALSVLSGVVVTGRQGTDEYIFEINFSGNDSNKYHNLLKTVSVSLNTSTSFTISKIQDGSPINATSPLLETDLSVPNAQFYESTELIDIGTFKPQEIIPIWIERDTLKESGSKANDGVSIRIRGIPII